MRLELLDHQNEALAFIRERLTRGLNVLHGDPAGTGKTLPALHAAREFTPEGRMTLWVTLASLKEQLTGEITKFSIPFNALVLTGTRPHRLRLLEKAATHDMLIINYEQLLMHERELDALPLSVIVSDECTRLGNPKNKTYKVLNRLARGRYKIALSGTPITNTPMEAYALFEYLNPRTLGSWMGFAATYMAPTPFSMVGAVRKERLPELATRLAPYYIRRKREDLLPNLPELMETDLIVELSAVERKLYDQLTRELLLDIPKEQLDQIETPHTINSSIVKFARLRQLCVLPALLGTGNTTSTKLDTLKEFVSSIGEGKAIVFTEFSSAVPAIVSALPGALSITGGVKQEDRARVLAEFQNSPAVRFLVMTRAGEMGLNLQAASHVIHYDPPLTYSSYDQRVSRARRNGRKDPVVSVRMVTRGTLEERIYKLITTKQEISLAAMPYSELRKELLLWESHSDSI